MIPFLDIKKINDRFKDEFQNAFDNSLEASNFILGENVKQFESEFAAYCNAKFCIGTGNGLDALTIILRGYIQLGQLTKGDKVLVPANTFIATILSVIHAGLEPVLVEPNPETYNVDANSINASLSNEIKAVIVVHLYGQLVDVSKIKALSGIDEIIIIEDAAQAHGAANDKVKAGNMADAAAFSFYPTKNLGALGDGGAITTNNPDLHKVVKQLRNYGSQEKYKNNILGFNSRLDDLQASFLKVKLKCLNSDNQKRRAIAKQYLSEIINPKIELPCYSGSQDHVFYAFVVEVVNRKHFTDYLNENNVGWLIHYPIPPHQQEALQEFSHLKLPITEYIHQHIVSLPISPVMNENQVSTVINVLNNY